MNKLVICTGANGGIGRHYCREMLNQNYDVVLACRNMASGKELLDEFKSEFPNNKVELQQLDMGSFQSIRNFATEFLSRHKTLDVLMHNAGVYFFDKERKTSQDNIELNFAIHYAGPFLLTSLLFDQLKSTTGSKVVAVSSSEHRGSPIDLDDLQISKDFESHGNIEAYSRSKWATVSFVYTLADLIKTNGLNLHAVAAHPGLSITGIQHKGKPTSVQKAMIWVFGKLVAGKPKDAAGPLIMASLQGSNGEFYGPTGFKEAKGKPGLVQPDPVATNLTTGHNIWRAVESIIGEKFEDDLRALSR